VRRNAAKHIVPVIDRVVEKLIKTYKPEKIFLYGSYAYGNPDDESDIDILIVKKTKLRPIDRRIAVRKLVSHLRKKTSFSPLVVTPEEFSQQIAIGNDFFGEIATRGKILYEKR
jgi:uncharacterized protein